jgi:hypothetical protein
MAEEDYNVADRRNEDGTDVKANAVTAGDKVAQTVQATPDADAKAAADTANVSHPAYIGYAAALNTHQARPDIESLASRRLREYGDAFADANYMRAEAYEADGDAVDGPRPGTVHGDAPRES